MKRFFVLLMACMLFVLPACAEEYTVAEKLYKQLWAGSGVSGVLNVEINSEAFSRYITGVFRRTTENRLCYIISPKLMYSLTEREAMLGEDDVKMPDTIEL